MRRFLCFFLVLLVPFTVLAEDDWANANLPKNRMPEFIETVPWDEIQPNNFGQHHYLLLCIDEWQSLPRPADATPPPLSEGRGPDKYGNTDGMVILTLDTAAHRITLASIVRDAAILKPGSTDEKQYYGRIFHKPFMTEQEGQYAGQPLRTFSGGDFKCGYSDHYPTFILVSNK